VQTIGCKEHHDLMADIVHQAAAGRLWWYQQPDTSSLSMMWFLGIGLSQGL
jgi:hypothetical protein